MGVGWEDCGFRGLVSDVAPVYKAQPVASGHSITIDLHCLSKIHTYFYQDIYRVTSQAIVFQDMCNVIAMPVLGSIQSKGLG